MSPFRRTCALVAGYLICLAISAVPTPSQASAWGELPRLCEDAAARAAASTGVPLSVLRAIALTETGRTKSGSFRPWPWTVNMEGKGVWFDTLDEARDYVRKHHDRGARSYDVGCFQINYRWHGKSFQSVDQMFDPVANANYAARFLGELYEEFGDWSRAAGAYHSRTPEFANRYRTRFDRIRAKLQGQGVGDDAPAVPLRLANATPAVPTDVTPPVEAREQIRDNRFPLLHDTGNARGLASLVPLEIATGRRLIDVQGEAGG